jgi:phosphate transport system substrate-binding protein
MRLFAAAALCTASAALAQVEGNVTVTGSSSAAHYARAWATAFQREHPRAPVRVLATSSAAAPKAMVESAEVIGMMSRPMRDAERTKVAARHGKPPVELKVAVDAVGIYVHKTNPMPAITVTQIQQVFSATPGLAPPAATWGELGAQGSLAKLPIAAFGFERGHGAYEMMRERALGGTEFHSRVVREPVATSVVQAVGVEPGGIGYASVSYRTSRTRLVPVAFDGGEPHAPTDQAIMAGRYPLARYLYLYAAASAPAASRKFVEFALSDDGQAIVKSSGGIPISREVAATQLERLAGR